MQNLPLANADAGMAALMTLITVMTAKDLLFFIKSLCNTQFVFCGLEIWGGDLDGDLSCFILRLNDDDGLAAERLRCEGAE